LAELRQKATALETVRCQRPDRIGFRFVRGPVPHLVESFLVTSNDGQTGLRWEGEFGTDRWAVGEWWGERVARSWTGVVHGSLREVGGEAECRASDHLGDRWERR